LAELEDAARRNLRSAEEARRVLAEEHQRLQQEASARTKAQQEALALRRELDRLHEEELRRAASEKTRAERAARAAIADEIKRFHQEHERVVAELDSARGALSDHDGLLEEYTNRLREEQHARAALRQELERAEAARSLAERGLEAATENARRRAEDETIRLATSEQQLADMKSDRDRFEQKLAEMGNSHEIIEQLRAQLADVTARLETAEDTAARLSSQSDLDLDARLAEAEERAREAERVQGRLRREASDATKALPAITAERDELRVQVAALQEEVVRARADSDRLRAHAAALGDEQAALRASVAELQAAAPAPALEFVTAPDVEPFATPIDPEPVPEPAVAPAAAAVIDEAARPPLPLRIAGRHAPAPEPDIGFQRQLAADAAAHDEDGFLAPDPGPESAARRTAMAELTAIASTGPDDFAFRRK
jgi:chromosome segregation ATPase